MPIVLDHIALGLPRFDVAVEPFEERLGGVSAGGWDGEPFSFRQWEFAGGGRIEVIVPTGPPNGFVHRFLAAGGPRVHHVTIKVPDLDAMLAAAKTQSYEVVGIDRSDSHWQQAFLHPKQAQGIVVQMVEQLEREGTDDMLPVSKPRAGSATIVGLRMSAKSIDRARRQWAELLGASGFIQGDSMIFRWEKSPLVVLVDIRPDAEEGPLQIEVRAPRDLALPSRPYPGLGTRFVQVR